MAEPTDKSKLDTAQGTNAEEYASSESSQDHSKDLEKHQGEGVTLDTKAETGKESGGLIKDGKHEIDEEEYNHALGFAFSPKKKWYILTVIFWVQMSMNFNASVIGNAIGSQPSMGEPGSGIVGRFGVSTEQAYAVQGGFLLAYGIGSELWAPFSEEYGRWPILQLSLFLVNVWQIPFIFTPTYGGAVAARVLGGLSSAGGSVTLGMVADLYQADDQQWAVLFVVLSSVGGSVIGPIFGGFIEQYANGTSGPTDSWQWVGWVQLIFGLVVQIIHFFTVPETRSTIMLDKKAKKLRKENPEKYGHIFGPTEMKEKRLDRKEILKIWARPFIFFFTEPIVLCLSLLSGFSDALIFTFLEAFSPVYSQWNFSTYQIGLAFVPIALGYLLAYGIFVPDIKQQEKLRREKGSNNVRPERRLKYLLYIAPLEAIGLFGFAFTSYGPSVLHGTNTWIASMFFSTMVGIANFAIYYTTIDYMVAAYGPYSASATGGNALARDGLAGIAAFYAAPMYGLTEAPGIDPPHNLIWGSVVLGGIAILVTIPIYIFYFKGEYFRTRSKYAQTLAGGREDRGGRRMSSIAFD